MMLECSRRLHARTSTSTPRPRFPPGTQNYITRLEGANRLKQRLNDLLEKKRALAMMSMDAEANQPNIGSAGLRRV